MDQGLKERLVGAAVLVAIAVWLIPWVLDGPEGGAETPASSLQLPSAEEPMPMRTQTLKLGDAPEPSASSAAHDAKRAALRCSARAAQARGRAAPRAGSASRDDGRCGDTHCRASARCEHRSAPQTRAQGRGRLDRAARRLRG